MSFLKKLFLLLLVLFVCITQQSCNKFQQSKKQQIKRQKQLEIDKERKEKEAEQAYNDAIMRHYSIQDQNTKKMMKQTSKKSYTDREHKREFFIKRWFSPKQKKSKSKRNYK